MAKASTEEWVKSQEPQEEATAVKTVHVTMLIDRSGSMSSIRNDVIGGFNSFLHDQQAQEGECLLTLCQFDSGGFDTLFSAMSIREVRDASEADFLPRGSTPLYDAVGQAITAVQVRQESAGTNEQPVIVILTDGYENASREYTAERLKQLITAKEAQGWIFTYLGANQDAVLAAGAIGIHVGAVQNFVADSVGTTSAHTSLSSGVTNARVMAAAGTPVNSANFYGEGTVGKTAEADHQARTDAWSSSKQSRHS